MSKKISHKAKDSKKAGRTVAKPKKEAVKKKAKETKKPVSIRKSTKKNAVKKTSSADKIRTKKIASSDTKEKVLLPENMPLSSVNKSIALRKELDKYIQRSVYIVAYVTAICFILVGSTVAFVEILGDKYNQNSLKAETITSLGTSSTSSTETIQLQLEPQVDIIDTIPHNIIEDYRVNFVARNVSSVQAYMVPVGGGNPILLDVQKLIDDKYRTFIKKDVPSRYYTLKISYQPLNGSLPRSLHTKEFFVGTVDQEQLFNNPNTTINNGDNILNTDTSSEIISPVLTEETNDLSTTTNEVTETESKLQATAEEETNVAIEEEEIIVNTTETTVEKEETPTTIDFRIESTNTYDLTGTVSLRVRAPLDFTNILLYARPLNSLTPFFVTSARIISGSWIFVFDTRNLPNNEYEFFARTTIDNKALKTPTIKRKVFNTVEPINEEKIIINSDSNQQPETTTDEIHSTTVESNQTEPIDLLSKEPYRETDYLREFAEVTENDFKPTVILDEEVNRATDELLKDNLTDFQELLKIYAVALQSEDETLINAAKQNLINKRESIILSTLNDDGLKDISDNIDEEMIARIDSLKDRVETFEQIRRDRSSGETSIDSDGDGISDFDEINLYRTDPHNPDTDNDGFNDGIEIIRGFNPNSAEPESAIVFESPKESKLLEQNELLKVESVTPVITKNENSSTASEVKAEIRGIALPNSFVTLYIFSSPTVVTIKTDVDGSFVYTFDKELEDGEHEVYVAVTDNTGSIIAQSSPFSFVKEAEAFEPVGVEDNTPVTSTSESISTPYNLVIGLAVLSLGIILLMLGMGLRTRTATGESLTVTNEGIEEEPLGDDATNNSKENNNV